MKKIPQYIIDKAIELRVKHKLTVPEIAERMGYSKATVNGWMEAYPLEGRTEKQGAAQIAAAKANRENAAKKRQEAYDEAWEQAPELFKDPEFYAFICMYLAEGTKKTRNEFAICNSDASVMVMAYHWMEKLRNPERHRDFGIQYHEDQDEAELKQYWAELLHIEPEIIKTTRKSNSRKLSGRNFASKYGVLTIRTSDTYLVARIYGWMDYLREMWLDKYRKK